MIARRVAVVLMLPLLATTGLVAAGAAGAADRSDERLVTAVRNQDHGTSRALLKQRVDVNARQGDGTTALHWAAYHDDLDTAALLIRAGAKVNATTELGVTPLYLACMNRSATMIERLATAGANVNAALPSGETALMTAARTGNVVAVKTLLAHGATVNTTEPMHGQTALMWAAAAGHSDVVQVLIENGADVTLRSDVRHRRVQVGMRAMDHDARSTTYIDLGGFTPLMFAAREGTAETAKLLLDAGADVNESAPAGTSALVVAAHSGNGPVATFLLENGADPNDAGAGYTALHAAVLRGDLALVKMLLDYGADANAQLAKGTPVKYVSQDYAFNVQLLGATPYFLAARFGEIEMMRALAAAGADPRRPTNDGMPPVMASIGGAGFSGSAVITDRRERFLTPTEVAAITDGEDERLTIDVTKAALEQGADVNAASKNGDTALHTAASRGYVRLVEFLLAKGANISATNQAGDTPLHSASSRGSSAAIQMLVDKGASLEAKNKKGQTPLAMTSTDSRGFGSNAAAEEGKRSAGELLRRLGAKE